MDVRLRTRYAEVDAAVELDDVRQRVSEPNVNRSNPVRACFHADQAEELYITVEFVHNFVAEGDRVDEFGVMTAPDGIAIEVKLRHQAHAPVVGQLRRKRDDHSAFDRVIAQVILARRQLHEGDERQSGAATVIAPEVPLESGGDGSTNA